MKKILLLFIIGVFLSSCNKEKKLPNREQVINKISNMSNLGTVEYSLSKIIEVNDKQWFTIGPRKVLLSCKAYVKAGIDFTQIKVIEIDDSLKSIKIEVPDPKIIIVSIPPSEIKLITTDIGFFRYNFTNEELNEVHKLAEIDINHKINELNILSEAKKNGKIFLFNFLSSLGFEKIIIVEANYIQPIFMVEPIKN